MTAARVWAWALAVCGAPAVLWAQSHAVEPRGFAIERLRFASDHLGVIDAEWAAVLGHRKWELGAFVSYANDPLVLVEDSDQRKRLADLIAHRLGASLTGAIGIFEWLEVGAELPLVLYQGRSKSIDELAENPHDLAAAGMADLRLVPKARLLGGRLVHAAVLLHLTLPTSTTRAYLGDRGVSATPEIALSTTVTHTRLLASLGYRIRQRVKTLNLVVDDEIIYRLGVAHNLTPALSRPLEASAVLSGATGWKVPFRKLNRNPLELLLAGSYEVKRGVSALIGMGVGLLAGAGTPDFRFFTGLRYHQTEPPAPPPDSDGDGLRDPDDRCPRAAEDRDGFADEDGCPDPDNDADGILDAHDQCPNDPETKNGHQDEDGCPDELLDTDGDGIIDRDDRCPQEPENANGYEDEDGCPEEIPDTDADGLADPADQCPEKAEDKDGFEDGDGCPDPDNDGDGVQDIVDQCPDVPGPVSGAGCPIKDRDNDGIPDQSDNCPDEPGTPEFLGCQKKQLVKLSDERIEILEKVFFDTGRDTIKQESFDLLDNIATVLNAHPEIAKVRIEGHTDSRGSASYNKDLSQRRAESVLRFLVDKGVAADRLEAAGFGEEKPIASNETTQGRAANRRVEFLIVSDQGKTP